MAQQTRNVVSCYLCTVGKPVVKNRTVNLLRESQPQFSLSLCVRKDVPCSFKRELRTTSNSVSNCGR